MKIYGSLVQTVVIATKAMSKGNVVLWVRVLPLGNLFQFIIVHLRMVSFKMHVIVCYCLVFIGAVVTHLEIAKFKSNDE